MNVVWVLLILTIKNGVFQGTVLNMDVESFKTAEKCLEQQEKLDKEFNKYTEHKVICVKGELK